MARKARWLGLLATYRELSPREREAVDRHLEDDDQSRELARLFAEQDALLSALTPPCPSPTLRERVMAATVARGETAASLRWRPVLAAALSLVLLVLVAGTGVASSGSLPGDTLYPVKRASEQVRLAFTLHDQGRAHYMERLIEIRRQEVNALLGLGRAGVPVAFEGPLEHSPEGEWLVAGVPVIFPNDAGDPSQMVAGSPVHVTGEIGDTEVHVEAMRPLEPSSVPAGRQPEPGHERKDAADPAPSATPTHEPTATPQEIEDRSQGGDDAPPTATLTPTAEPDADAPEDAPRGAPPGRSRPDGSTPPGLDKGPGTPAAPASGGDDGADDEDRRDAGTPSEGQVSPPAATEPPAENRGAVDRDPDGHPDPTRRPPWAGPPGRRTPGDASAPRRSRDDAEAHSDGSDAPPGRSTPPAKGD